ETTIRPVDGLLIDGSMGYIHVNYDEASVAKAGLHGDETFPYTPDWNWSLGIQYDWEQDWGTITPRFDGSYRSKIFTDTFNTPYSQIDGRFLANARLTYENSDKDWKAWIEVQNLFDKYYFLSVSDITRSLGAITAVPALPRTWSITVKKEF